MSSNCESNFSKFEMENSTTSAAIYDQDILTLTPTTTLSDVVAATIHDISSDNDSSCLDQYLGTNASSNRDQHLTASESSCQYLSNEAPPPAHNNHELSSNYAYHKSCQYQSNTAMVTPTNKRRPSPIQTTPSYFSPSGDSRFNDSLSGLLGSPPPDSPLASNPFFGDLQYVLANECKTTTKSMPDSLMLTMTTQPQPDVFYREQLLQSRFSKLEPRFPQDVKQLSNFYRYQAAIVETDRFRTLHQQPYYADYQRSLNRYFDTQLHQFMERVEKSLTLLEESTAVIRQQPSIIKPRPQLSKKAIRVMEDWYENHLEHPYPSGTVIDQIAVQGNVTVEQVKKWFANKRNRSNNTRTLTEIARQKRRRAMQKML
ncbi:uncharacterized protein LOC134701816 [Mytilus trossulus]|uniref:uncharacterized protein LOC134701816 n=1 Tax=Mytilus trossulus TaxID=6551 RepID=UPI00300466AD